MLPGESCSWAALAALDRAHSRLEARGFCTSKRSLRVIAAGTSIVLLFWYGWMTWFRLCGGLKLEGCITLASLAKEDEAVKQLIGRAGGPSLVQAAMQRHKKCSDLQRWGHKGLLAITPSEDYNQATQRYEKKH